MKATFAHMGTSPLIFKMLLEDLGYEVVFPPKPSQSTLSLGAQYAPEFACIPFKIVLGTYLEVIKDHPDITIISAGGFGPCRAGYYGELQLKILQDLGYNPDMIFFWPPLRKPWDFYQKVLRVKRSCPWWRFIQILRKVWKKAIYLDDLELLSFKVRAREIERGSTTRALQQGLSYLAEAKTMKEIDEAREAAFKELKNVPVDNRRSVLKVGIVGEIYVQLEPSANFHIEEVLGEMGVEPRRSIMLTNYARHDVFSKGDIKTAKLASPYLDQKIGGHGQNSIGDVIRYAQKGYDGVIQLAPFTCIPEIVAKSIMPALSRDYDIPVMTLFIDEQTGQAGVETRLEAFVDLMRQRYMRKVAGDEKSVIKSAIAL